jgi:hypothetical protein
VQYFTEYNNMADFDRAPCPWRIVDDAGAAFSMGAIGGSLFSFWKGYRNSPPGIRFREGLVALKIRAPVLGGDSCFYEFSIVSWDSYIFALHITHYVYV